MAKLKNILSSLTDLSSEILIEPPTVSVLPKIGEAIKNATTSAEEIIPNVGKSIKISPIIAKTLPAVFSSHGCSVKTDSWVKKCALLADHCYGKRRGKMPGDCRCIMEFADKDSGTKAKIYSICDGKIIVCAFPGSGLDLRDWETNLITQPLGISDQYKKALGFARSIVKIHGDKVMFVGHSKGGGIAMYCAASLGLKAVVFNPAQLGDMTKIHIDPAVCPHSEIDAYVFWNDLVNIGQKAVTRILHPFGVGLTGRYDTHIVTDYYPEDIRIGEWHGMEGILRYFGVHV